MGRHSAASRGVFHDQDDHSGDGWTFEPDPQESPVLLLFGRDSTSGLGGSILIVGLYNNSLEACTRILFIAATSVLISFRCCILTILSDSGL